MKKIIYALLVTSIISNVAIADNFCRGYEQGYLTGYKQAKETSLEPLSPLCPLQPLKGFGDPESDFEHGYTIGFKGGTNKGYKEK